jgi:hypothetical protein
MAYDLARRQVTTSNFAINLPARAASLTEKIVLGSITAATLLSIMQDMQRQIEKRKYQTVLRPGLAQTQPMPAMPMSELMFVRTDR